MIYTVTFNPAIDYVVQLDSPLEIGGVNRASAEHCVLGGKGINVSGVLTELGCGNVALGFVAGETGAWLERGLAARGQRTDFIRLDSGMTRINVKIKGAEETELNGAGPQITPEAMEQLYRKLDALLPGDVLVLAGSIPACLPQDTYQQILTRLKGKGVRTAVDATGQLLMNVLPYRPFLIKPNHHELAELLGRALYGDQEIAGAARVLQQKGARNVLVSMAGEGALLLDEEGWVHRIGTPQGRVVTAWGPETVCWRALWLGTWTEAAMTTLAAGHCLRQRYGILSGTGAAPADRTDADAAGEGCLPDGKGCRLKNRNIH